MDIFYGILGLVILLLAGDVLVRGAVNLALRLGIPALIVSLTIVSLGTSAPELFISIGSVMGGAPGLAMGNVVGSNTANVLLVLGLPALIATIHCGQSDTRKSYLIMLAATAWFVFLAFLGPLTWVHGLLLLAALTVILTSQFREARAHAATATAEELEGADPAMPRWRIGFYLALGLVGLPVGADLLVDSAVNIATRMGVSETVIGLTLVAIGTSLPELATTIMAAIRRHAEVALGNVIGSNIFNLLAIIGTASLFGTIPVSDVILRFDIWIMIGASLALIPFVIFRQNITRIAGLGLTGFYFAYVLIVLV